MKTHRRIDGASFGPDALKAMGQAFDDPVPGLGGRTGRDAAVAWITAGCPLPPRPVHKRGLRTLWLSASAGTVDEHHTRRRRGLGAVH